MPDSLPGIASYWTGGALRWLERLSLASFVAQGHAVTLFHDGPRPDRVPDGVTCIDGLDVVPELARLDPRLSPAIRSDIFRISMIRRTGLVWADGDVICLRPFAVPEGYLVGRQEGGWINGNVLAAPDDSAALIRLEEMFADPATVFEWLPEAHRAQVMRAPVAERPALVGGLLGNAFGPLALTHMFPATGEDRFVLPQAVLNPLPWWLGDLYFDPRGSLEAWVDDTTLCLHLYASRLRPFHKRRRPPVGSPLAKIARRIGFDDFA